MEFSEHNPNRRILAHDPNAVSRTEHAALYRHPTVRQWPVVRATAASICAATRPSFRRALELLVRMVSRHDGRRKNADSIHDDLRAIRKVQERDTPGPAN